MWCGSSRYFWVAGSLRDETSLVGIHLAGSTQKNHMVDQFVRVGKYREASPEVSCDSLKLNPALSMAVRQKYLAAFDPSTASLALTAGMCLCTVKS